MKKIVLSLIMITFCVSAHAQFLKKLKKRVQDKVEETVSNKIENKAEEQTEKTLDSLLNKKKKTNNKSKEPNIGEIFSGSSEITYESEYYFSITATMQVTDYSKRKEETATMEQSYGKDAILSTIENTPGPIIMDFKNNSALIIIDNQIQVMSMDWMQRMMGDAKIDNSEQSPANVEKTGNTKVMNGYTCHEYNITHEDAKINAWFAPDVDFTYQDYLRGFAKMFAGKKGANPSQLLNEGYGYVMEMTAYLKGDLESKMTVTKLDKTPKTIQISNYTIQKLF